MLWLPGLAEPAHWRARGVMRPCTDARGGLSAQGSRYKVHNVLDTTHKDFDKNTAAVWENAEMFDPKTEHMFRYLQVRWQCGEGKGKAGQVCCGSDTCCDVFLRHHGVVDFRLHSLADK